MTSSASKQLRIFEINTRVFCDRFDQITEEDLSGLAKLGFDAVWLMGAWQIGEGATKISRTLSADFAGSPYAIADYRLSSVLGGQPAYETFRERAVQAGLKVFLDFIPNHMSLDSEWITENSELFVTSDAQVRKQDPGEFFLHCSGTVVAHGKDPYFPPWYDTAQLDYSCPELRSRQIRNLINISKLADGVRCDMAMLILRDYIRQRWYPRATDQWFSDRMPAEFWGEAISAVKQKSPGFIFLAEAYWGKEPQLQQLGFDLTYEKNLYDALVERSAPRLFQQLWRPIKEMNSSLFFIENHDEARAAAVFTAEENIAAMALILSLPGSVLVHQGQMDGFKQRLPIQLARMPEGENPDQTLRSRYESLLKATRDPVFADGGFRPFSSQSADVVSFLRFGQRTVAAYIGQIGGHNGAFAGTPLNITSIAEIVGTPTALRLTDIIGGRSVVVPSNSGSFIFQPGSLGLPPNARFCLLRVDVE